MYYYLHWIHKDTPTHTDTVPYRRSRMYIPSQNPPALFWFFHVLYFILVLITVLLHFFCLYNIKILYIIICIYLYLFVTHSATLICPFCSIPLPGGTLLLNHCFPFSSIHLQAPIPPIEPRFFFRTNWFSLVSLIPIFRTTSYTLRLLVSS